MQWDWICKGYGVDFGKLLCMDYYSNYEDVYGFI